MLGVQDEPAFGGVEPVGLALPARAVRRVVLEEDVGPLAALFAPVCVRFVVAGYVVEGSVSLSSIVGVERWWILGYPYVSIVVVVDC